MEEVVLDPDMTIGGAPDTHTTMESPRTGRVTFFDSDDEAKAIEEDPSEESPEDRKRRIREGFESKRDHWRQIHRERMLQDKSAQLIRRRGYTWAEGVPRVYPYRPSRRGEKGSVAFAGDFPTSGKDAQQDWLRDYVGDGGKPGFRKVVRSKKDKGLYKRSYARLPPMRSRQGPARRRDPIRINDTILKAEEAARAQWGWYRSEDVYVTT